jgi:hypothetical protein
MAVDIMEGINRLVERMKLMEDDIEKEAELLKQEYLKASNSMPESQNYFLNGIQAAHIAKSYLMTRRGIEVLGEDVIPIPTFIDSVIQFANYPKRKIEVMVSLAKHLEKINELVFDTMDEPTASHSN